MKAPKVAVVDYGMGNLFSVRNALEETGMTAVVTRKEHELDAADAVILPGVGGFGAAMATLRELELIEPLRAAAASGRPFVGICLGLQLMMTRSFEFGEHEGLGILEGDVVRLDGTEPGGPTLKVPRVGWGRILRSSGDRSWEDTPLRSTSSGTYMYFVHSYRVEPGESCEIASCSYGDQTYCCAVRKGSVFGFQFHPERSGAHGLTVYRELAEIIRASEAPLASG